jgi:Family of unknown function (DUF5990)
MEIRIEGDELPGRWCGPFPDAPGGWPNIHVAVQRRAKRDDLLGLERGDAPTASWTLDCAVEEKHGAIDVKGAYIQGPVGGRFIYLSWGNVGDDGSFRLFRRAKLWLDGVPPEVLRRAVATGVLVGRLGLTDAKGHPRCAAVRPPLIEWSSATR